MGDQVPASLTVASDNNEIYAITMKDVIKLVEDRNSARIAWRAKLDMYPERFGQKNYNLLTATVAANGIAVQVGEGYETTVPIPLKVGVGLLDRETGELRSYCEGPEESVSVTAVGPDGSIYIAHSPFRRAISRALLGDVVAPLKGGVAKYKPVRLDLLARDAVCGAAARTENAYKVSAGFPMSAKADIGQIRILLAQSRKAIFKAVRRKDLSKTDAKKIEALLISSEKNLSLNTLDMASNSLKEACNCFQQTRPTGALIAPERLKKGYFRSFYFENSSTEKEHGKRSSGLYINRQAGKKLDSEGSIFYTGQGFPVGLPAGPGHKACGGTMGVRVQYPRERAPQWAARGPDQEGRKDEIQGLRARGSGPGR